MAFTDYQNTIAWNSALELGPKLTQLAEELPVAEQNGLAQALLCLALDLPTAIGIDIQTGSNTRNEVLVRLQTALELTNRIYPALDIVSVERALEERIERFTGPNFSETIQAPSAEPSQADSEEEIPALIDQPIDLGLHPEVSAEAPSQSTPLDTAGTVISLTPTTASTEVPSNVPTNIQ